MCVPSANDFLENFLLFFNTLNFPEHKMTLIEALENIIEIDHFEWYSKPTTK